MIKLKKILLFCLLMISIMQEVKAISPAIAVNNMKEQREILNKKRNSISNNGFVVLNKEERINKILENNKIPKFYLVNLSSLNTIEDSIKYLRKKFNKYNVEILYIEVIPFCDEIKAFIIFDTKPQKIEEIKKEEWYI